MRVGIVGAGIGGLALAQGLSANGADIQVFERDPSPTHRRQGYRIHINTEGEQALRDVLPALVHQRVIDTASQPGDLVAGYDSQLIPQFEQTFPGPGLDTVNAVDRYAFRRALMTGLGDVLRFGHELTGYTTTTDGQVELRFADGRSIAVDVLVGADGVGSRVRTQLLPNFNVTDIGVRCVYGKLPLTDTVRSRLPTSFLRGFCFVSDRDTGIGVAFAPVLFRQRPEEYGDYLMTVLTGTNTDLGHDDVDLFTLSPGQLWQIAVEKTARWHPTLREAIIAADPTAAFPISLRSCTRIDPWPTGRVTLLGDAIHPMTPAAGSGANTALWDAARLCRALTGAQHNSASLPTAIAGYEQNMVTHAMPIITESLHNAERMFASPDPARR